MLDIDYEILENLGSSRMSLRYIIDTLNDKSNRDDRLDSVIHGCHELLDEVEELEEEYEDRANADEDHDDNYMMEDVS